MAAMVAETPEYTFEYPPSSGNSSKLPRAPSWTTAGSPSPSSPGPSSPGSAVVQYLTDYLTPGFDEEEPRLPSPGYAAVRRNSLGLNTLNGNLLTPKKELWAPVDAGSQRGCIVTLIAGALGAGVLALPYAFSLVGVGLGMCILVVAFAAASLSLPICLMAGRYTNCKTYSSLLALALQKRWASTVLDITLYVYGVGVLVASFAFQGDFLVPLISLIDDSGFVTKPMSIIGIAIATFPLCLPSDVSFLRYFSALSPVAILFTAAVVIAFAPGLYAAAQESGATIMVWNFEPQRCLKAASIFIFGFMCHVLAVPISHQLDNPSTRRIVKVTTHATSAEILLYTCIGLAGYCSWGAAVQGDFLVNYPAKSPLICICRCLFVFTILMNTAVTAVPTCKSMEQFILGVAGRATVEGKLPWLVSKLIVTFTVALSASIALVVPNAATVISILGGSIASLLMFWLPGIIYLRVLWPTQPKGFRFVVLSFLWGMGAVGFASVGVTCWEAYTGVQ